VTVKSRTKRVPGIELADLLIPDLNPSFQRRGLSMSGKTSHHKEQQKERTLHPSKTLI